MELHDFSIRLKELRTEKRLKKRSLKQKPRRKKKPDRQSRKHKRSRKSRQKRLKKKNECTRGLICGFKKLNFDLILFFISNTELIF